MLPASFAAKMKAKTKVHDVMSQKRAIHVFTVNVCENFKSHVDVSNLSRKFYKSLVNMRNVIENMLFVSLT